MNKSIKILIAITAVLIILSIFVMSVLNYRNKDQDGKLTGDGCLILVYHRVLPANPVLKLMYKLINIYTKDDELALYSVYADDMKKQIEYLKEQGANFISIDEFYDFIQNNRELPSKSVMVTFDDTDLSVYKNAYPLLKREDIPFTLFIISGYIGDQDFKGLNLCTQEQIQEMIDSGLAAIGSHTHNYHFLSKRGNPPFMYPEKYKDFAEDAKSSFKALKKRFGIQRKYFCYPYGFGTPDTDEILLEIGVDLIFTLRWGVVQKDDSPQDIKRVLVNDGTWKAIAEWAKGS